MSEPAPSQVALKGLCPRCGNRTLFNGMVAFAPKCRGCGLDFSSFNVGDGAVPFLIFIVGGMTVFLAIMVELKVGPPWWVHVLLWVPFATVATVGLMRLAKGLLLALEYRHRAEEGRIRDGE
ncbi:MAG TPA: DUF983 domain-containing protein [Allosphingosinicella sp.]